ncbi:hypothetical protein BJ741DRAFT_604451 [Chytriomyces cf. hyalinus JEL632]|nr:hypothetical protein BJ741DRAFT_604451 [Chytriomyces cf. hyalinus JEL632]
MAGGILTVVALLLAVMIGHCAVFLRPISAFTHMEHMSRTLYTPAFVCVLASAPFIFFNPLLLVIDSPMALFYNYNVFTDESDRFQPDIKRIRDNTVVYLAWKQKASTGWMRRLTAMVMFSKVHISKRRGNILRIRLHKAQYLFSQTYLFSMRMVMFFLLQRTIDDAKTLVKWNIFLFGLNAVGLACLLRSLNATFVLSGNDCANQSTMEQSSLDSQNVGRLKRGDSGISGLHLSNSKNGFDDAHCSGIQQDEDEVSLLCQLSRKQPEITSRGIPQFGLENLEFAFANSLNSGISSSPERRNSIASFRRSASFTKCETPELQDFDSIAAEFKFRYKNICRLHKFVIASFIVAFVAKAALVAQRLPGLICLNGQIGEYANHIYPAFKICFLFLLVLWRILWTRWLDDGSSARPGRLPSWIFFSFLVCANLVTAATTMHPFIKQRLPLMPVGSGMVGLQQLMELIPNELPWWAGAEFLQLYELNLGGFGGWMLDAADVGLFGAVFMVGSTV